MIFNKAEDINSMINSFDFPTTISPDMKKGNEEYASISIEYTDSIRKLKNKYDLTSDNTILSLFIFNLLKFSFSKDILVAYNKKAIGYHFNTELSVKEYLNDFKSEYDKLEKYEDKSFDSEILFTTQKYNKEDYKFIFSHDNKTLKVEYDISYYSKELINAFLTAFNVLADKFKNENELLKNISIVEDVENDEDFKIELANNGLINKKVILP